MMNKTDTRVNTKEALGATMKTVFNRKEGFVGRDVHFNDGSHKLLKAESVSEDDGKKIIVREEVMD